MTGMSSPSSETMCTSTDDCFCQEHVRQSRSPNSAYAQRRTSSAGIVSTSGSCRLGVAKQHLLERVAAQAEPQRLEWDDLLGRDVPEVHVRPELLDEPGLRGLRRRLEDQVLDGHLVHDLVDETGPHLAVRAVDPGGPALPALRDHLPGARRQLLLDPFDPLVRGVDDLLVLRADLGEDGEVARELLDQLELALTWDVEGAVRDLDVREALLDQPAFELLQLAAGVDRLEERPAADDRGLEAPVEGDLLLQVVRDVGRAPAELDDVYVLAGGVEEALDLAQVEALVDHVREALGARLAGAGGQVEESIRAWHRAPPASCGLLPERRGRASCRGRRSRRGAGRRPPRGTASATPASAPPRL